MADKTKTELKAELDNAVQRIMELQAENETLKKAPNRSQAHDAAEQLRPDVEVLGAKFAASGVLVAAYVDGKQVIYDQDALAALKTK